MSFTKSLKERIYIFFMKNRTELGVGNFSIRRIAGEVGCCERTVLNIINQLEKEKYIEIERNSPYKNRYKISEIEIVR